MKRLIYERNQREWTTSEVARRLTDNGFKISQSSVWSIENDPRRKITFAEAVAFADLYDLRVDQLTEIPKDITGPEVAALLEETFAIRRDGAALVTRLATLLQTVEGFNNEPPEQVDALYEYLGIRDFGVSLKELKSALRLVAKMAGTLAETIPEHGVVVSFESEGEL